MKIEHLKFTKDLIEHADALVAIAQLGATKVLIEIGKLPRYVSKNEAGEMYGSGVVNRWINDGLLKEIKDGEGNTKCRIDRLQLDAIAATSNSASYYIRKSREEKCKGL